ncbi:MAG TPA: lamin tail domain-containing protein [Sphingomonadales bacterium]|nr:lamin tail domain-containing protein [Sphingomonadales bacterium]
MRKLCFAALALAGLAGQTAFADLQITEVMSTSNAPAGSSLDSRDWWELTNRGPGSVLLDNYSWEDNPIENDTGIFPAGVTIAAGESIIILQGSGNAGDFRTAWNLDASVQVLEGATFGGLNDFSGLSSGGDAVNLFDSMGMLVSSVSFGPSTSGFSFEWDQAGANLGLSAAGEHGAYQITYPMAINTAVGSPGYAAVPEPGTILLLVSAVCGLAVCRSRRRNG